jgi:hypothetical protein
LGTIETGSSVVEFFAGPVDGRSKWRTCSQRLEVLGMAVPQCRRQPSNPWYVAPAVRDDDCVASATIYWYFLSKRETRARVAPRRTAASWANAVRAVSGDADRDVGERGIADSLITALLRREELYLIREQSQKARAVDR